MAEFACPVSIDALWAAEFLAVIQCRFNQFSPPAMSKLLRGVVDLPGLKPGAQWLALAVARCAEAQAAHTDACNLLRVYKLGHDDDDAS